MHGVCVCYLFILAVYTFVKKLLFFELSDVINNATIVYLLLLRFLLHKISVNSKFK